MEKHVDQLENSGLFSGIARADIEKMLICLNAKYKEYEKGEMVFWEESEINDIGVVLSGRGHSIKSGANGKTTIISLLEKGSFIGVLLAASQNRKSPVSVQAAEDFSVMFFPFDKVVGRCQNLCPSHDRLIRNFLNGMAEKALELHDRNDCLIKPTVREKILTYLTRAAKNNHNRVFTVPLDRKSMAEYLNVERSALSRELSRMKKDGLLDFYKNDFKLKPII